MRTDRRGFLGGLIALALAPKVVPEVVKAAAPRGTVDGTTYLTANVWAVGPPMTYERMKAYLDAIHPGFNHRLGEVR